MGRASLYTEELADSICEKLADGESLNAICEADGMPSESTVRRWDLEDREGFSAKYARAREIGYEREADDILKIADEKPQDQVEATWQKTRIDARKWVLSKKLPKKYGDVQKHEHSGGVSITLDTGIRREEPPPE